MQSGIITKHTVNVAGNNIRISGDISPKDVKRYLLYWDKIIYPTVNGIGPGISSNPDLEYLQKEGIISTDEIAVSVNEIAPDYRAGCELEVAGVPMRLFPSMLVEAQARIACEKLRKGEIWTIGQTGDFIDLPSTDNSFLSTLEFTLYGCLPVPGDNVSFEEVINFRIDNKPQLNDLQKRIEEYRTKIAKSDHPERELVLAKLELEGTLREIASIMSNKRWKLNFESLKSYLEIKPNSLVASALGAVGANGVNLPPELGGVAGYAVNLGLGVVQRVLKGFDRIPEELRSYVYVYNAGIEKVIKI